MEVSEWVEIFSSSGLMSEAPTSTAECGILCLFIDIFVLFLIEYPKYITNTENSILSPW